MVVGDLAGRAARTVSGRGVQVSEIRQALWQPEIWGATGLYDKMCGIWGVGLVSPMDWCMGVCCGGGLAR